jgi:tRNA-dihydrouridine synthase B
MGIMFHAENMGASLAREPLRVGGRTLSGRALLAPMAGVTDAAMRGIADRFGASATVAEMITAEGVARGDRETKIRLAGSPGQGPRVIQIAARDRMGVAEAARYAETAGADWIDINMGCPCKRVTGGFAGSALMRDLDHAASLVAAAVEAVALPVTVKMRLGWDDASRNAAELATRAEREGAAMITVHGRTRQQFYKGVSDWRAVAEVKTAVGIPVVANGDCCSVDDAAEMLRLSGADAVMIGRAAIGQPWLVGDAAHFLEHGQRRPAPSLATRFALACEHLDSLVATMGALAGLRHARKHLAAYVDRAGVAHGAEATKVRQSLLTAEDPIAAKRLLQRLLLETDREEAA